MTLCQLTVTIILQILVRGDYQHVARPSKSKPVVPQPKDVTDVNGNKSKTLDILTDDLTKELVKKLRDHIINNCTKSTLKWYDYYGDYEISPYFKNNAAGERMISARQKRRNIKKRKKKKETKEAKKEKEEKRKTKKQEAEKEKV